MFSSGGTQQETAIPASLLYRSSNHFAARTLRAYGSSVQRPGAVQPVRACALPAVLTKQVVHIPQRLVLESLAP